MRRVRDFLWSATLVVFVLGLVLAAGRVRRRDLFTPAPYTGGLLVKLAIFGLLPLALLATVLAMPRLAAWLGIARGHERRDAPKHAPPPDGPTA